jgi:hypothetical protein
MRMVEVSSGVGSTELVAEVRRALYGALCNHRDAVHVRRTALELATPVQSRLQAAQVVLHIHNDYISLTNLQPSEPRSCYYALQDIAGTGCKDMRNTKLRPPRPQCIKGNGENRP